MSHSQSRLRRLVESGGWQRESRPAPRMTGDVGDGARQSVAAGGWCGMAGLPLLCAAALLLLLPAPGGAVPPPEEAARMARFVLHSCDWGALATLSAQKGLRGHPFANIFSLSDGPPGRYGGSGVPYLYLTDMEISVQDLEVSGSSRAAGSGGAAFRPLGRRTAGTGVFLQKQLWHCCAQAAAVRSGPSKEGLKLTSMQVTDAKSCLSCCPRVLIPVASSVRRFVG